MKLLRSSCAEQLMPSKMAAELNVIALLNNVTLPKAAGGNDKCHISKRQQDKG